MLVLVRVYRSANKHTAGDLILFRTSTTEVVYVCITQYCVLAVPLFTSCYLRHFPRGATVWGEELLLSTFKKKEKGVYKRRRQRVRTTMYSGTTRMYLYRQYHSNNSSNEERTSEAEESTPSVLLYCTYPLPCHDNSPDDDTRIYTYIVPKHLTILLVAVSLHVSKCMYVRDMYELYES